jgi:hypothetical protein
MVLTSGIYRSRSRASSSGWNTSDGHTTSYSRGSVDYDDEFDDHVYDRGRYDGSSVSESGEEDDLESVDEEDGQDNDDYDVDVETDYDVEDSTDNNADGGTYLHGSFAFTPRYNQANWT